MYGNPSNGPSRPSTGLRSVSADARDEGCTERVAASDVSMAGNGSAGPLTARGLHLTRYAIWR